MSSSTRLRRLYGLFTATNTRISQVTTQSWQTHPTNDLSPSPPDSAGALMNQNPETFVSKFIKASENRRFRLHSRKAYERTVRRLAAAQLFSCIEEILDHQKKYEEITIEYFTVRLISLYGRSGMFDHAHKLFNEMPQLNCVRTVMSFNALLSACVNSKKYDKIAQLFCELPEKLSIKPNVISYNTVINAFCDMGSVDAALSVIEAMEKNGVEPNLITFNTLLEGFYKNDRLADAEKVWALMESKNVVPDARSYNPKLRALVSENRISVAVELFQEMRSKGVKPNVFSFNSLIKGYCDDGNMEEAKRWYAEMSKNGCTPDRLTFEVLGYYACDKGDFDFSLDLCKDAIRCRCPVDSKMMQLVVNGLVKEAKMKEAQKLVNLGKSNNFRPYKLTLAIPTD